ncbi:aldo/keto reductase [Microbacterium sp. PRC9]|uniref:aldo/keto reductase n=1 Tax=Microbacterium sp. PRC9 TaxID=2962591 RepID=UPI00288139D7|nr:aldo/keto reductase [Microbacterium sp. PRC9]MDT0144538.1 aldo/keto reductase [Microbacterium sp. PRC9]
MTAPQIVLNNGVSIPQLGFGVFQIEPEDTKAAVLAALEAGYRHIDGAQGYRNEREVGEAIAESGIDPAEIFLTSKLSNAHLTYDEAHRAIDQTIVDAGVKTPDLFLLHWPLPTVRDYMIVWRAVEEAYRDGIFPAVGVSNFHIPHLERLLGDSDIVPAVNQIELHPYLSQKPIRDFDEAHGIVTEAWSPIGQGLLLKDDVIGGIAAELGRTPAQVVLRWHLQSGIVVFPKSSTPERMRENIALFDFELTADQMAAIDALNRDQRTGMDPDTFRYKF